MSILSAREVTYEYRNAFQTVRAVNGVSCEFEKGLVYAIVGSSGSGKTTFLSLLAGLDDSLGIGMIVAAAPVVDYKTTFGVNNLTIIL